MKRSLPAALLLMMLVSACSTGEGDGIDVIDVSGPLDASALEFMIDSIDDAASSGQEMAVLQINSRAVLDQELLGDLTALIEAPPLPVAVWLGPAPARAFGGLSDFVVSAPVGAAAPGSFVGHNHPVIAGGPPEGGRPVPVEETGIDLQPSIRQYLQELDGSTLPTAAGDVEVSTLVPYEADGVEGVTLRTVTFRKPGFATRFLRLAATPEAAFFFLVVGLTLLTFEFYALGPGVAAGVAAISLWLGGRGIVNLPVRPWALALTIIGWVVLTTAYQRGNILGLTLLGAIFLQVGGMFFIQGSGQIDPRWWLVLLSVLAALFFFLLAMPTVSRSRLSTQTIGRDALVGSFGIAVSDFDPDGMVEVGESRWRATAHREAGLVSGAPIQVTGVDGLFLEVEPFSGEDAKNE